MLLQTLLQVDINPLSFGYAYAVCLICACLQSLTTISCSILGIIPRFRISGSPFGRALGAHHISISVTNSSVHLWGCLLHVEQSLIPPCAPVSDLWPPGIYSPKHFSFSPSLLPFVPPSFLPPFLIFFMINHFFHFLYDKSTLLKCNLHTVKFTRFKRAGWCLFFFFGKCNSSKHHSNQEIEHAHFLRKFHHATLHSVYP